MKFKSGNFAPFSFLFSDRSFSKTVHFESFFPSTITQDRPLLPKTVHFGLDPFWLVENIHDFEIQILLFNFELIQYIFHFELDYFQNSLVKHIFTILISDFKVINIGFKVKDDNLELKKLSFG